MKTSLVSNFWIRLALFAAALAGAAYGYVAISELPKFTASSVHITSRLGGASTYTDGRTPDEVATANVLVWNKFLGRLQFTTSTATPGSAENNRTNEIWWGTKAYGEDLPAEVLAVTILMGDDAKGLRTDSDIIVNSSFSWASYTGSLWYGQIDLGRVIAHEVGHIIGLDHPDEAGQTVVALMNSEVSSIDSPTDDDQSGAASLYGEGPLTHMPVITSHPVGASLEPNESYRLYVQAIGWGVSYQWYKDGVLLPGKTDSFLWLSYVSAADAGVYTVRLSNSYGKSVTSTGAEIKLTAPKPPSFSSHPANITLPEGAYDYLSVSVTSLGAVSYAWYKDNVLIPNTGSPSLWLRDVRPSDSGQYRVEATNAGGTVQSRSATVTVLPAPLPTVTRTSPADFAAPLSTYVTLSCTVSSVHTISLQWLKDGVPVQGATYEDLNLTLSATEAGTYVLEVTNPTGTTRSAPIVVRARPAVTTQVGLSTTDVVGQAGQALVLSPYLDTNMGHGGLALQWCKDGVPLKGEVYRSLTIPSMDAAATGTYTLTALGPTGVSTSSAIRVGLARESLLGLACVRNGVLYCVSRDRLSLDRWNTTDGTRLPSIALASAARAIAEHPRGLVIATSLGIPELLDVDAGTFSRFTATTFTLGNQLVWKAGDNFVLTDGAYTLYCMTPDGQLLGDKLSINTFDALVRVPSTGGLLGHRITSETGPEEVATRSSAVGLLGTVGGLSRPGYLPALASTARGLWLDASGTVAITGDGTLYSATAYKLTGQLLRGITDLVPLADGRNLLLGEGKLIRLSGALAPEAWREAPANAARLFLSGTNACVLSVADDGSRSLSLVALGSDFTDGDAPRSVGETNATPITEQEKLAPPDYVAVTGSGLVCEVARTQGILNLWDPATKTVTRSLRLRGTPARMVLAPGTDLLVLSYRDGLLTRINVNESPLRELPGWRAPVAITSMDADGDKIAIEGQTLNPDMPNYELIMLDTRTGKFGEKSSETRIRLYQQGSVLSIADKSWYIVDGASISKYQLSADLSQILQGGSYLRLISRPLSAVENTSLPGRQFLHPNPTRTQVLTPGGHLLRLSDGERLATLPFAPDLCTWNGQTLCTATQRTSETTLAFNATTGAKLAPEIQLDYTVRHLGTLPDGRVVAVGERNGVVMHTLISAAFDASETIVPPVPTRLVNMSVQAQVGVGDDILVPGLVVRGQQPKGILVRGIGPGLKSFNVKGTLYSPILQLFNVVEGEATSLMMTGWGSASHPTTRSIGGILRAFDVGPDSDDAALTYMVSDGLYTTQTTGYGGTPELQSGRALVEIYDADPLRPGSDLSNMSARCRITPESPAIGGFVIQGTNPMKVLLRAIGPRLEYYKVTGVLPAPKLTLYSGQTVIATNSGWSADADKADALRQAFKDTGAFSLPDGSKDAALLVELQPGNYTVWMESADGSSGVSLLELYVVEQAGP